MSPVVAGSCSIIMSVSQYAEDWESENVVRVVLVNPNFEASLTKAVEELSAAKLR